MSRMMGKKFILPITTHWTKQEKGVILYLHSLKFALKDPKIFFPNPSNG
jgi:hypothetical protein